ncbi:hypothetical protein R6Z07F_008671 [Ovis aries]
MAGEVTQGQRRTGPRKASVGEVRGMGDPELTASGGVGGRSRGRGRLADAAANWWADPESPRKRGRLSAVQQARLCGSGSPLLQRSPWQSQSLSAQPSPSAARRRHCSSRPLRLRLPFPLPICLKLPKISAAPVPAAAGL